MPKASPTLTNHPFRISITWNLLCSLFYIRSLRVSQKKGIESTFFWERRCKTTLTWFLIHKMKNLSFTWINSHPLESRPAPLHGKETVEIGHPGRLPRDVFLIHPTGRRSQGRPNTRWRDYSISPMRDGQCSQGKAHWLICCPCDSTSDKQLKMDGWMDWLVDG